MADVALGAKVKTVPITVRVSYGVLKELLCLPDDVEVLGIHGVNDLDGTFPLILETPLRHIKGGPMTVRFRKEDGKTHFDGFSPSL